MDFPQGYFVEYGGEIKSIVVSTFLMLVVIPMLYSIFNDLSHHTKKRANQVLHRDEGQTLNGK